MRGAARRGWTVLVIGAALCWMGTSCVHRRPTAGRLPPLPERPRITASAAPSAHAATTNAWRPVGGLPRLPAETNVVSVPPVSPAPGPVAVPPAVAPERPLVTPAPPLSPAPPPMAEAAAHRIRPLDPIVVNLRGIQPKDEQLEDQVDEAGYIRVTYLDPVKAAGKTATELEDEIERLYIEGKIYKRVTVQVVLPSQSFYVDGEVKQPGRLALLTGLTLMQAIAQAGGFTDFADRDDLRIVRSGKTLTFSGKDIAKHPEKDVRIEPGDRVTVGRSLI